jgi:ribose transport system ATP-binding protein
MRNDETILKVENLYKAFGSTQANDGVDFELKWGEVHGLVGENGSGKSTLLSQIAGTQRSDSGTIYLNGDVYAPHSPLDAYRNKIGTVVQEYGLIGALPGNVNVFLGQEERFTKFGIINVQKMNAEIRDLMQKWDLADIPLGVPINTLSVESRKQLELLRALSVDPDILILDEITQALSYDNRLRLHNLLGVFKRMGRSVIIISHDLEEIVELADRLTVLRDGKVVGTVDTDGLDMNELKRMMVGREMEGEYYRSDAAPSREEKVVLSVDSVSVASGLEIDKMLQDVSFDVHAGEIVGFCGLSDSGIHTIGKVLYGIQPIDKGTVRLDDKNIIIKNSQTALHENLAYVPKERDGEGLMMQATIRENFSLPSLDDLKRGFGMLRPKDMDAAANDSVKEFAVKCKSIYQEIGGLSGGNKQKVNLGRWLAKDLSVLILDCPTRGVDVGAKSYIYNLMKDLKAQGLGMVLISDELLEVLGMADRIFVMKTGQIKREILRGPDFTEEEIIEVML